MGNSCYLPPVFLAYRHYIAVIADGNYRILQVFSSIGVFDYAVQPLLDPLRTLLVFAAQAA